MNCQLNVDCGGTGTCSNGICLFETSSNGGFPVWLIIVIIVFVILGFAGHHHRKGRGAHHGDYVVAGHGYDGGHHYGGHHGGGHHGGHH